MKKLTIAAALAAAAIAVPMSIGSSHREAPLTSIDPTGDDTDLYAFTAEDAPEAITIASNWVPFEDPAGGPNFYTFDDNARYYINVDNTGDGVADIRYLFDFDTKTRNPNSFLYTNGQPVDSVESENLNVVQTYSVTREEVGRRLGSHRREPPHAAEQRRPEDDPGLREGPGGAIQDLPGGGKVFAGQREDPFFASLGRIFDTVNLEGAGLGNEGGGVDDLAGYCDPLDRAPGSRGGRDGRRQARRRREGRQRGRRRLGLDRAADDQPRRQWQRWRTSRSPASATRSSTR